MSHSAVRDTGHPEIAVLGDSTGLMQVRCTCGFYVTGIDVMIVALDIAQHHTSSRHPTSVPT